MVGKRQGGNSEVKHLIIKYTLVNHILQKVLFSNFILFFIFYRIGLKRVRTSVKSINSTSLRPLSHKTLVYLLSLA